MSHGLRSYIIPTFLALGCTAGVCCICSATARRLLQRLGAWASIRQCSPTSQASSSPNSPPASKQTNCAWPQGRAWWLILKGCRSTKP